MRGLIRCAYSYKQEYIIKERREYQTYSNYIHVRIEGLREVMHLEYQCGFL